jgi:site-specific DNA-methyltransferase (adenine-specific)
MEIRRKKIMNIDLRQGDCLEVLKTIPDNSVDSVVVDPPYHLTSIVKRFGKEGSAPAQFGTDGAYARASKGFMGKEWDGGDIAFRTEVWSECLRVLKPGGHLLSFSHSRTYHRMAVAIEDAGFEIRDSIMWIYGSGFPKSHNIGKKLNDYEGWGTALKPAHEPICMARKPLSEKSIAENVLKWGTGGINIDGCRIEFENTPNAATNPKFRKENNYKMPEPGQESNGSVKFTSSKNEYDTSGRFPANIILDEEAGKLLDEQSGIKQSQKRKAEYNKPTEHTNTYTPKASDYRDDNTYDDKGGASRFFYCPKTSKKERNAGIDNKITNESVKFVKGGLKCEICNKWKNSGSPCICDEPQFVEQPFNGTPNNNTHPTVKPIKLMEYLIKLVTPKGGVVMDCFMGSGSTGIAAKNLGFSFIGIEREQEYFDIAQQRIGL